MNSGEENCAVRTLVHAARSNSQRVHADLTLRVALELVLEEGGPLLLVERFVPGARQARVEHSLVGPPRPARGSFAASTNQIRALP